MWSTDRVHPENPEGFFHPMTASSKPTGSPNGMHKVSPPQTSGMDPQGLPAITTGVQVVEVGEPGTSTFRLVYLDTQGCGISPWQHIPLHNREGNLHLLCTTPRGERGQLEVSLNELWAPLRNRLRSGKVAPFAHKVMWNYGILPQTWADKEDHSTAHGGLPADNRPLEAMEIGSKTRVCGEVYAVKPLASFVVMDPETFQLSWKIITIAADDPMAAKLHDVADMAQRMAGTLEEIREWLRVCQCVFPGDRENLFGLNERAAEAKQSMSIVAQAHSSWQLLTAESFPHKSLPLESSPYEPWTWARAHGIRPARDSASEDSFSSDEAGEGGLQGSPSKLPSFVKSYAKLARPAYFEPKPITHTAHSEPSPSTPSPRGKSPLAHKGTGDHSGLPKRPSSGKNTHLSKSEREKAWREARRHLANDPAMLDRGSHRENGSRESNMEGPEGSWQDGREGGPKGRGGGGDEGEQSEDSRGDTTGSSESTPQHRAGLPPRRGKSAKKVPKKVSWSEYIEVREIPPRETAHGGEQPEAANGEHDVEAWHGLHAKAEGRPPAGYPSRGKEALIMKVGGCVGMGPQVMDDYLAPGNGEGDGEFTVTSESLAQLRRAAKQLNR